MERSLVIIKPDGVEKNLIGEIIKRYEKNDLKITTLKMVNASEGLIGKHYPEEEKYLRHIGENAISHGEPVSDTIEYGRKIVHRLKKYLTRAPIVKMIIEGENAIAKIRKINGVTDPSKAEKGTIRGDLGTDAISRANKETRATENLVHASGNTEEAEREIEIWFGNNNKDIKTTQEPKTAKAFKQAY